MQFQHLFTLQISTLTNTLKDIWVDHVVKCEMMILGNDEHSAQFRIATRNAGHWTR